MAIVFSEKAPEDGYERIKSHLSKAHVANKSGINQLKRSSNMFVSKAIQIWTIGLNDLDRSLNAVAFPGEWQYLIIEDDEVIAGVQVSDVLGQQDVSVVSYGPMTSGIIGGLKAAGDLPTAKENSLEPRLLLIPSITFVGLWLHNLDNNDNDVVIPIPPSSLSFEYFSPVSVTVLEPEIKKAAEGIRAQIKAMPEGSGSLGGAIPIDTYTSGISEILLLRQLDLSPSLEAIPVDIDPVELTQFIMQDQPKGSNWCWSAVGTSVGLFYKTGNWSQCDTATAQKPGENCCKKPTRCYKYGSLADALIHTKSFNCWDRWCTPIEKIQKEIEDGNPVCTRVRWKGGGAHVMAITGVNGNYITIQDPLYETSTIAYDSYPNKYQSIGGDWTTTYFCKPNLRKIIEKKRCEIRLPCDQ